MYIIWCTSRSYMRSIGPCGWCSKIWYSPKARRLYHIQGHPPHILFLSDRSSVLYMIIPHTRFIYSIYTQPHQRDDVIIILLLCNYSETWALGYLPEVKPRADIKGQVSDLARVSYYCLILFKYYFQNSSSIVNCSIYSSPISWTGN